MNVTLRHLRAAVGIARCGSFRSAADSLHVSQPALSQTISELESELGVTLFDRTSRSVRQTELGRNFVLGAQSVLVAFDRLIQETGDVVQSRRGRVVVSCVSSIAGRVLPLAIMRCAQRYPEIDVVVQDDVAIQVLSSVQAGDADFGLTIEPAALSNGMQFEPLHEDRFFLVCQITHLLAKKRQVSWRALKGESLIALSTTSGTHGIISAELERQQVHVTQQTLVSHLSTVHGMLDSGFGVAVLPKIALPVPEHPTLVSIPLVQPVLSRTIGVYRRRDRSLSPAAAAFLDFTRDVLQELGLG